MKVYSWKTLVVTILIGGGMFIYEFKNMMTGKAYAFLGMMFFGYLVFKGLWVSLTEEGFQADRKHEIIYNIVMRKLFGSWAFIVPHGGIILILLVGVAVKLIPSQKWLPISLFIGGLLYQALVGRLIKKHMKLKEQKYF